MTVSHGRFAWFVPFALLLASVIDGCQAPIEVGASAADADALITLLHGHHVGATKQRRARVNGTETFDVSVLDAELPAAVAALRARSLHAPGPALAGVLDEPSWIPTPAGEQLRIHYATARQLEATILLWDDVVAARVQIAATGLRGLSVGTPAPTPTAAVVIKHHAGSIPSVVAIQKLVAHAVAHVRPENVTVLLIEAQTPVPAQLTQLGPIAVTTGSAETLRLVLVALLLAVAIFVTLVALAWRRSRQDGPAP